VSHFDEFATLARERRVIARKPHDCDACCEAGRIRVGDEYVRNSTLFDGSWEHANLCLRCVEIAAELMRRCPCDPIVATLDCGETWLDTFGEVEPPEVAALAFMLPGEAVAR